MAIGNKGGGGGGGGSGGKDVRAGGAYFEVWGKDALTGTLDKLQKKAATFGAFMQNLGRRSGLAAAALAAPLALLFRGGANRAADIGRMAEEFQIPVELMARIKHAADDAGASVQDVMNDTTGRFDKLLARPSGLDPKATQQAAEAQQKFAEATRALEYAMLPLLDVITPIVTQIAEFVKQNSAIVRVLVPVAAGLLAVSVGATAVGPALSLLVGGGGLVLRLAAGLYSLMKVLAAVRVAMIATAVKTAVLGAAQLLWYGTLSVLSGGLAVLTAAIGFLLSPIGLATVAVVGLAYVFRKDLAEAGKEAGRVLSDSFRELGAVFGETWEGLVAAVKAGDLEGAFRIVGAGVRAIWAQLLVSLAKAWNAFVTNIATTAKNNPLLAAALGAGGGALAGFFAGGPLGAVGGAAVGGFAGLAASEFADDLAAKLKIDVGGLAADAAARRAGLRTEAGKVRDDQKYLDYPKKLAAAFDSVKGAFNTFGTARQQFGYGSETNKQTALQQRIAEAAEGTNGLIGRLADALKAK
jgi:hypothetical protein